MLKDLISSLETSVEKKESLQILGSETGQCSKIIKNSTIRFWGHHMHHIFHGAKMRSLTHSWGLIQNTNRLLRANKLGGWWWMSKNFDRMSWILDPDLNLFSAANFSCDKSIGKGVSVCRRNNEFFLGCWGLGRFKQLHRMVVFYREALRLFLCSKNHVA